MRALWILLAVGGVAKADPVKVSLGMFEPVIAHRQTCDDCKTARTVPVHGIVRVLRSGDDVPDGKVVVTSPLLGYAVGGTIDHGTISIGWFDFDQRDSDAGVLLLPPGTAVRFVVPAPADVAGIKEALIKDDALSVGSRVMALKGMKDMEVGAIDVDGDGKADFAATYGCTIFGDGGCQSRGQFFLARRGQKWAQIE